MEAQVAGKLAVIEVLLGLSGRGDMKDKTFIDVTQAAEPSACGHLLAPENTPVSFERGPDWEGESWVPRVKPLAPTVPVPMGGP